MEGIKDVDGVDLSKLCQGKLLNRRKDLSILYKTLSDSELDKLKGSLCAIDAEFVALSKEEYEIHSDGTRSLIRPSRMSLARVSVLRGESGELEGVPFIDDYIHTTEVVLDYLTEYSGIKVGDLDPSTSTFPLVSFKTAYRKLRMLVDLGCIFVGHGLKKDFRTINILVPPEQVIDTVDIYYLHSRHRKLSLRFLAWYVLKSDIQTDTHDSIEDAQTALALYKKYLELSQQGKFQEVLEEIYEEGRSCNYKPPTAVSSSQQRTSSLLSNIGGNETPNVYTPTNHGSPGNSPPRI
ncbi:poly(A)-specific ribonuclease [Nowakowskiella sp. JEL0407]|nr:poly(A)-specific ribonuclease [Nowakowskiella sp. JEL0407]